ncbi:MAG: hypothetical protein AB8B64_26895 [Granulosicoccus sp.]
MINENSTVEIDDAIVTAALNGILTTDKFSASPQMSAFLKYVVEQTLMGNTRRIKAFTVGIEALGKSSSFDPQTDPSVRVLAKRLRSSLDAYYEQNPTTPVFIEMKPGSYIPKFILRSEMRLAPEVAASVAVGYQGETETAARAEGAHAAHVSVQTPPAKDRVETDETRKPNVNQLWQAYRSASKVA